MKFYGFLLPLTISISSTLIFCYPSPISFSFLLPLTNFLQFLLFLSYIYYFDYFNPKYLYWTYPIYQYNINIIIIIRIIALNCIKTLKISQKSSLCCKIFYKNSASIQIMEDVTVVTKNDRQSQELAMLLGNEHRMKSYARSVALNSLYHPMDRPQPRYAFNKNGDQIQTEESIKQQEAWDRCKARCHGNDLPTLWDVMMEGQAFEAITNSNNFVALRDTAGLKPIDESKMVVQPDNPLSNMSMEQLELLDKISNMDPNKVQKLLEQVDGNN